jgi:hypothetical protein
LRFDFIRGTVGKLYFEGPGCISPNFMQDTEGKAKVRAIFAMPFYTKNDHFTKTGSA